MIVNKLSRVYNKTMGQRKNKFSKKYTYKPDNVLVDNLISAFASLKSKAEIGDFLRDLMTEGEIAELSNRLEIARKLTQGQSYLEIANEMGTSTTTVSRVAQWLYSGCNGYKTVLERKYKKIS